MLFLTTAKGKPNPLATRCLERTTRIAGRETTPRTPTTSMVDQPRRAFLARLTQAMPMDETSSGTCLSTNWSEVSHTPSHAKHHTIPYPLFIHQQD